MSLDIEYSVEKSSIFFKKLNQTQYPTCDSPQASILFQALHLHAFISSLGKVTKKTLLRGNLMEKDKALGSNASYSVTWQEISVQNISAHTFPASIQMTPFPYKWIKKLLYFKPKPPNLHYNWGGVGDRGLFHHSNQHLWEGWTFAPGPQPIKNHIPLHCVLFSRICCLGLFSILFSKELEGKYLLLGSPFLLLWYKGSVQVIGFQELFSGLPLTLAFEVSCNETLQIR